MYIILIMLTKRNLNLAQCGNILGTYFIYIRLIDIRSMEFNLDNADIANSH